MADPEFGPGSEHIAHAPMTNNTLKAWTYDSELYLVKDGTKYTSSGIITFTLAAGSFDTIDFPITMPDVEGTYKAHLGVYVGEELVGQVIEDVTIVAAVPVFAYSNERGAHILKDNPNYSWLLFECDITNPTDHIETEVITLWNYSALSGKIKSLDYIGACNGSFGACPACKDPGQLVLTLAPGETYHYRFCNYNCSILYVGGQHLWLEDDRGGESLHKDCGSEYAPVEPVFSYSNMELLTPRIPGEIEYYIEVSCDITNTGGEGTLEVSLWVMSPRWDSGDWIQVTRESFAGWEAWAIPGGTWNAGTIMLTLAPGETFHFHYAGRSSAWHDYTYAQLRDAAGGASEIVRKYSG